MGLFRRTRVVDILFVGCDGTDIDRGIYSFYLDTKNGELLRKKFIRSLANPISMSKNERFVNMTFKNGTGREADGGVWQYAAMDLQLGLVARVSNLGRTYIHSLTNSDRTYTYAVDYYNGEVVIIPIVKLKNIRVADVVKHTGSSIDPIKQTEPHPCFICETPDKKIAVCDLGTDEVVIYNVADKGRLLKDEANTIHLKAGSGPRKMLFSPDGKFAYIMNEISSTIAIYAYNEGTFTFVDEILSYNKEEYTGENMPTDIIIANERNHFYVCNKGDDTVILYERNEETGKLTRIDFMETDVGPIAMELFRDKWLVVCAKQGGSIESFEVRDGEAKGILFETHYSYMLHGPVCMIKGAENYRVN